jgi:hypothetical protein
MPSTTQSPQELAYDKVDARSGLAAYLSKVVFSGCFSEHEFDAFWTFIKGFSFLVSRQIENVKGFSFLVGGQIEMITGISFLVSGQIEMIKGFSFLISGHQNMIFFPLLLASLDQAAHTSTNPPAYKRENERKKIRYTNNRQKESIAQAWEQVCLY